MVVRTKLTRPVAHRLQRGDVSPLLDGVVFGETKPNAQVSSVKIISVMTGSKASDASLRAGDVTVSVNQDPVTRLDEFAAKVRQSQKQLPIDVLGNGSAIFFLLP
jgi:S1-C subfamily serine protease